MILAAVVLNKHVFEKSTYISISPFSKSRRMNELLNGQYSLIIYYPDEAAAATENADEPYIFQSDYMPYR